MDLGKLYIVATPIGNLDDITIRAIETLKTVDVILAEDTRHSKKLLNAFEIKDKRLLSCHQHSNKNELSQIIELLEAGKNLALISDAGTPGINDPGNILIAKVLEKNSEIEIIPIPGVSAVTTLLSIAGLDINPFIYLGFLPHKKGKETILKMIASSEQFNFVFLDNPKRLAKNLVKLEAFLDKDRQIIIGRELTKMHETIYRGNINQIIEMISSDSHFKGEVTVLVAKK